MFKNTNCLFDKIIPKKDLSQCSDHNSYGIFRQGIFDVSAMNLDKYWEIDKFLSDNINIISKIECYLLKEPLFSIPYFQFVNHGQVGFKFLDKNNNPIRHLTLQLESSWYPVISDTMPLDLPLTCKVIDNENNKEDIILKYNDKTAIYSNLLEKENYASNILIEMNKYTYFKGVNLTYLSDLVNFNFFLESYRVWRNVNTNQEISQDDIEPSIANLMKFDCSYKGTGPNNFCSGGSGDGSLFVFNGFTPSFSSQNEGCIMHFATLESKDNNVLVQQFKNFIKWNFSNFQCYNDLQTHAESFSKHYVLISPASFNYNWCLSKISNSSYSSDDVNNLFLNLRPNYAKNLKASWLSEKNWDINDKSCQLFDYLISMVGASPNIIQASLLQDSLTSPGVPFLCQGENYTCETYVRYVITMLMNNDTWKNNGVNVIPEFDFTFNNLKENDMDFQNNIFRAYSLYWPVAIFDDGYENGVPESVFNTDPKFENDKILFSKQTQLFKYLFKGDLIEASKTKNNPIITIITEILSFSGLDRLFKNSMYSSIKGVFTNLIYCLFLYDFLGVEEVFLPGYPVRKCVDNNQYEYVKNYDCEPYIYKFQVGKKSRAAIANYKSLQACLDWISYGASTISSSTATPVKDPLLDKLKVDISDAIKEFQLIVNKKDLKDPNKLCSKDDNICKNEINIENQVTILSHYTNAHVDMLDAFLTILQNPSKISKLFLKDFGNKIYDTFERVYTVLNLYFRKFTTFCHQSYILSPQILFQTDPANTVYNFKDFARENTLCANLKCNLDMVNKPELITYKTNILPKKFKADFRILNPNIELDKNKRNNTVFYTTLIICIILIIIVIVIIILKISKKIK